MNRGMNTNRSMGKSRERKRKTRPKSLRPNLPKSRRKSDYISAYLLYTQYSSNWLTSYKIRCQLGLYLNQNRRWFDDHKLNFTHCKLHRCSFWAIWMKFHPSVRRNVFTQCDIQIMGYIYSIIWLVYVCIDLLNETQFAHFKLFHA
jgi:hypothetical protein